MGSNDLRVVGEVMHFTCGRVEKRHMAVRVSALGGARSDELVLVWENCGRILVSFRLAGCAARMAPSPSWSCRRSRNIQFYADYLEVKAFRWLFWYVLLA